MAAAAARLSSAAAIMLPLLAANDGSGAGVAAFTAIHSAPAAKVGGARIPPAASTALSYMSGGQGSERLPKRTKSKVRPSKKNHKAAVRGGGGVSKPRGLPTTEEELAVHVQSVFADLEEFSFGAEEEDEDGDDDDEPCVLEDDEGETAVDESALARKRQLDSCRKLDRHSALVLNADYQPLRMLPLSTWSWQTTIKAVLTGKAVVVDVYPDVYVRAVSLDMPVPSVIALHEYAPHGKSKPAFTRRNVFLRDGYRCQYCNDLFRTSDLSLDHVEPRCFGGKLSWENTVTCCRKCNCRKGCLRPSEIHKVGMKLRSQPRCPTSYELAAGASKFVPRRVHPTWAPFLGLDVEEQSLEVFNRNKVKSRK